MTCEAARKKLEQLAKTIFQIPGVHGIGIGLTPDSETRDYSIFVDTDNEEARAAVSGMVMEDNDPSDVICTIEPPPATDSGMLCGEKELGADDIIPDTARYRPIPGGVRIAVEKDKFGTLCAFVKSKDESDDKLYMLSNRHVLKEVGNIVCQPAYHSKNSVGTVVRLANYNLQDAAIAEYTDDRANAALNVIQDYGKINGFREVTEMDIGKIVVKRGARTRYTRGRIDKVYYIYSAHDTMDCTKIVPVDGSEGGVFVKGGDSGSPLIMEGEGTLVGLVCAGPSDESGKYGIACSAAHAFHSLNITLP